MNWQEHISFDPKVMLGKLVVKGTRIPIDLILEKLAEGETMESLLKAYPSITREDILAVFQIAAEKVNDSNNRGKDDPIYVFSKDEEEILNQSEEAIRKGDFKNNEQLKNEVRTWLHSL